MNALRLSILRHSPIYSRLPCTIVILPAVGWRATRRDEIKLEAVTAHEYECGDARAWLPQIVRNTCDTWLEKNRPLELSLEFDERFHLPTCHIPETIKIAGGGRRSLVLALETLPPRFCDTAKEGFSLLKPGLLHPREGHAGAVLVCERN